MCFSGLCVGRLEQRATDGLVSPLCLGPILTLVDHKVILPNRICKPMVYQGAPK